MIDFQIKADETRRLLIVEEGAMERWAEHMVYLTNVDLSSKEIMEFCTIFEKNTKQIELGGFTSDSKRRTNIVASKYAGTYLVSKMYKEEGSTEMIYVAIPILMKNDEDVWAEAKEAVEQ